MVITFSMFFSCENRQGRINFLSQMMQFISVTGWVKRSQSGLHSLEIRSSFLIQIV